MPQLDSDAFTYSNGNLATVSSAKWTKLTGMTDITVATNAVRGSGADCAAQITTWSGSTTSQYAQIVMTTKAADEGALLLFGNGVSTYYYIRGDGANGIDVYKVVTGSFTQVHGFGGSYVNGDTVYAENQAGNFNIKVNGASAYTFTDTAITSGKPGVGAFSASGLFDDWAAGDFAAGGGAFTPGVASLLTLGVQ